MSKTLYKIIAVLAILTFSTYFTTQILADAAGRINRTTTLSGGGCGSCHGSASSTATTLRAESTSGSFTTDPEGTLDLSVYVKNDNMDIAGINIAVKTSITGDDNAGTLSTTDNNLKAVLSELTHSSPKTMSNHEAGFSFSWKAPKTPGTYYLRAVGVASVSGDHDKTTDKWNWMTPKELIVRGIELQAPAKNEELCAGNFFNITWNAAGISKINILLSTDGGSTWGYTLKDNYDPVSGSWKWDIPSDFPQGSNCKIKLVDVSDPSRFSTSEVFSIFGPISFVNIPVGTTICENGNVTLSVTTAGGGIQYKWRKNGAVLDNTNSPTYSITNAKYTDAGLYSVIISSACAAEKTSPDVEIKVNLKPKIKVQADSIFACLGTKDSLFIEADGSYLQYQWYKNGHVLDGETASKIVFPNIDPSDAGEYYCQVSGICEPSVKSVIATVGIADHPQITTQPVGGEVCEGKDFTFTAAATGGDLSYVWRINDVPIPNSNSPVLKITGAKSSDQGDYKVIVNNKCGTEISQTVNLKVNLLPKIASQPSDLKLLRGDKAEFNVITQDGSVTFQWRKDGKNIDNATSNTYKIESVLEADAGKYDCVLTNSCGSTTSRQAVLSVEAPKPGARVTFMSQVIDMKVVLLNTPKDTLLNNFITNTGDAKLTVNSIDISGDDNNEFTIVSPSTPFDVEPGASQDVEVQFLPTLEHPVEATFTVNSNSLTNPDKFKVSAYGGELNVVSNAGTLNFGDVEVLQDAPKEFKIFNYSNFDVKITGITFDPEDLGSGFSYSPELPLTVASNSSEVMTLSFAPQDVKSYNCDMIVTNQYDASPIKFKIIANAITSVFDLEGDRGEVNLYPNPANKSMNINMTLDKASQLEIIVTNSQGTTVKRLSNKFTAENFNTEWDLKDDSGIPCPAGAYYLVIISPKSQQAVKFMIVR